MKKHFIQAMHLKKGGLHKAIHTPMGEKIPKAKVQKAAHSSNPHMQHMGQAALNMEGIHPVQHLMAKANSGY